MSLQYSNTTKRLWLIAILLLIGVFFFAGLTTLAQEATTEPEPAMPIEVVDDPAADGSIEFVVNDGDPLTALVNNLLNVLAVAAYMPSAVGFTLVLTSFTKRVVPFPANLIALAYMLVIWGIFLFVRNLGLEGPFEQNLKYITEIGNVLLAATGTPIATTWLYNKAVAAKVPIVGFSKTR